MQTIRTISNISFNSLDFFENKISDLADRRIIDWCYWIFHEPDTDEKKAHIHFVLKPSKRIDTTDLKHEFDEIDLNNTTPLSCTTVWRNTNSMDDWLLYAVHDLSYLSSKGQSRNIHYSFEDLKATDPDALRYDWNNIDRQKYDRLKWLYDAVENSVPFFELVQHGLIPIQQRAQFEYQYNALVKAHFDPSGGRKVPHEEIDQDGVIEEREDKKREFVLAEDIDF